MKMVQKYWVLSLLMVAGLVFSGCGESATDSGSSTSSSTESTEGSDTTSEESSEGSGDSASVEAPTGDFQMVSLSVPNMT